MIYAIIPLLACAAFGLALGALLAKLLAPRPRSVDRTAAEQLEFMRNLLAFLLVAAFISVLPVLTFKAIPKENEQILTYMLGQLSGMATMALGFYFVNKAGQDAVDAAKTDNTGKLADLATRALEAGTSDVGADPSAIKTGDEVTITKPPQGAA